MYLFQFDEGVHAFKLTSLRDICEQQSIRGLKLRFSRFYSMMGWFVITTAGCRIITCAVIFITPEFLKFVGSLYVPGSSTNSVVCYNFLVIDFHPHEYYVQLVHRTGKVSPYGSARSNPSQLDDIRSPRLGHWQRCFYSFTQTLMPSLPSELVSKILEYADYKTVTAGRRVSHVVIRVLSSKFISQCLLVLVL